MGFYYKTALRNAIVNLQAAYHMAKEMSFPEEDALAEMVKALDKLIGRM